MSLLLHFAPILLFVLVFVGSGLYFTMIGVPNAFYQVSPLVAILPAVTLGWILHKGRTEDRMKSLLDGVRHPDIITMCIIFILAGAFSELTKAIGSVDAVVNLCLSLISPKFLLIGLFLTSAFISTAIGTSMGTIATIAPIAAGLIAYSSIPPSLLAATVVGGSMFGDNLSLISDTTIAAVLSQQANMKAKLKLNASVALIAAVLTMALLFWNSGSDSVLPSQPYSLWLITPYAVLLLLAACGINVFITLTVSIAFAGLVGIATNPSHGLLFFSQNVAKGFASMNEIMLLSMAVGGLSGLASVGSGNLAEKFSRWLMARQAGQRVAQLCIAKMVSVFDILLANNTIAIIFSGKIAKDLAKQYKVPAHYSAAWLDIFSCVWQGLIPYGAQILLASTIVKVSPLSITPHVYYCYVLGIVSVAWIMLVKLRTKP